MAVKIGMLRKEDELPSDVIIVTSDGQRIVASSHILASASPVLEREIKKAKKGWNSQRKIKLLGVSSDAIVAFLKLLYSSSSTELQTDDSLELEKHGMQLLALSHAYSIKSLKKQCETSISTLLTPDRVIDTLKLAKLLDAPRLYHQCLRLVRNDFGAVRKSEGWRFVRRNDAEMELEVLEYLEEFDERKKRWKKAKAAQETYRQLGEAMDCLDQIFTKKRDQIGPLNNSQTYKGLQLLLRHFAKCGKKLTNRVCLHCNRMNQLLRLHADICDSNESCKVPIYEKRVENEEKFDETWRLLVQNVARARVFSSFATRRKPEIVVESCENL